MEISFRGKKALVTGAAQGIGLAVVKKLVECGAQVVALDIHADKLKEAVNELPGVQSVVVDLSDWSSIEKFLKNIGSLQLVVNNAGVLCPATFQELQEDAVNRMIEVNLKGAIAVCKNVVKEWISDGTKGAIVNISSIGATRPLPDIPVYSATKAGLLQYTRCLAQHCAPKGIRVNSVSPGTVYTEMGKRALEDPRLMEQLRKCLPMDNKLLDPEDIANAVAFLLCDKVAGKITGVDLIVDAGYSVT